MGGKRLRSVTVVSLALALAVGGCSDDDGGEPRDGTDAATTTSSTSTTVDAGVAAAATAYQTELRGSINDAIGFATNIQALHGDVAAAKVDAAGARARGADFVTQVSRTVEALDALAQPPELAPAPAIARLAGRMYLAAAQLVAATPDGRAEPAVASALRLKLLADATFDRARLLLQLRAGGLSARDRTLLSTPIPDFATGDAVPPHPGEAAAGPRTFTQARAEAATAAPRISTALASAGAEGERALRSLAERLSADAGAAAVDREYLNALQLAVLVAAESLVVRDLGQTDIADAVAGEAREVWNAVGPLLDVPPLA